MGQPCLSWLFDTWAFFFSLPKTDDWSNMARRLGLCVLFSRNTNIHRNIIKHNIRTSMNERIHFFIKKYISHTFVRVMFLVCERWVETRTDCYFDPNFSSPIAALLSHLGWGCSTVGHWGTQSTQSASWFSRWHLVSNWLEPLGTWLYYFLTYTCFCCFSA